MPLRSPRTSRPRALAALGLVAALTAGGLADAVALAPSAHGADPPLPLRRRRHAPGRTARPAAAVRTPRAGGK
ncbi:hypothetical protein ABZ312_03890 [Streptomyces sp. NPDC006207]|nr:hypothetical protein [Streptomyces sp. PA03-5A]